MSKSATCTAIVAATCFVALAGCGEDRRSSPADRRAVVVMPVPDEGHRAQIGRDMFDAAEMELKRAGGMAAGIRVELRRASAPPGGTGDQGPELTARTAAAAAAESGTVAWLGGFDSNDTAVALPLLNAAGVAVVSPAAAATSLTRPDPEFPGAPAKYYPQAELYGRSFARTVAADPQMADVVLREASRAGVRRIFAIDAGDTDGVAFSSAVEQSARRSGVEFLGRAAVTEGEDDWEGLLVKATDAGADAIAWGSDPGPTASHLWRAVAALSDPPDLIAGPAMTGQAMQELQQPRGTSWWVTGAVPAARDAEVEREFVLQFKARTGREPLPGAQAAASAMGVILSAIGIAARSYGPAQGDETLRGFVARSLHSVREVNSLAGPMRLSRGGDRIDAPVAVWRASGKEPGRWLVTP